MSSSPSTFPFKISSIEEIHSYSLESGIKELIYSKVLHDTAAADDDAPHKNNSAPRRPPLFINGIDLNSDTKDPVVAVMVSTSPALFPLSAVPFDTNTQTRQKVNFGKNLESSSTSPLAQEDSASQSSKHQESNTLHFYKQFCAIVEIAPVSGKDPKRFNSFMSVENKPVGAKLSFTFALNSLTFFSSPTHPQHHQQQQENATAASTSASHHIPNHHQLALNKNLMSSTSPFKDTICAINENQTQEAIDNDYLRLFGCGVSIIQMKKTLASTQILDRAVILTHCIPLTHSVIISAASGFTSEKKNDAKFRAVFDSFQPGDYPSSICALPSSEGVYSVDPRFYSTSCNNDGDGSDQNGNTNNSSSYETPSLFGDDDALALANDSSLRTPEVLASSFIAIGTARSGVVICAVDTIKLSSAASTSSIRLVISPVRSLNSFDPPASLPLFRLNVAVSSSSLISLSSSSADDTASPFMTPATQTQNFRKSKLGKALLRSRIHNILSWQQEESEQIASNHNTLPAATTIGAASSAFLPKLPSLTILGSSWRSLASTRIWAIGGSDPFSNLHGISGFAGHRLLNSISCPGLGVLVAERDRIGFLNSVGHVELVQDVTKLSSSSAGGKKKRGKNAKATTAAKRTAAKKNNNNKKRANDSSDSDDDDDDSSDDEDGEKEVDLSNNNALVLNDYRYGRFSFATAAPMIFSDSYFLDQPRQAPPTTTAPAATTTTTKPEANDFSSLRRRAEVQNTTSNNKKPVPRKLPPNNHHLIGNWIVTENSEKDEFILGIATDVLRSNSLTSRSDFCYREWSCKRQKARTSDRTISSSKENEVENITLPKRRGRDEKDEKLEDKQEDEEDVIDDSPLAEECAPGAYNVLKMRVSHFGFKTAAQQTQNHQENNNNNEKNKDKNDNDANGKDDKDEIDDKKDLEFHHRMTILRYDVRKPEDLSRLIISSLAIQGAITELTARATQKRGKGKKTLQRQKSDFLTSDDDDTSSEDEEEDDDEDEEDDDDTSEEETYSDDDSDAPMSLTRSNKNNRSSKVPQVKSNKRGSQPKPKPSSVSESSNNDDQKQSSSSSSMMMMMMPSSSNSQIQNQNQSQAPPPISNSQSPTSSSRASSTTSSKRNLIQTNLRSFFKKK